MHQTTQPVIWVAKWIVDRRAEHVADVDGRDDAHALHDDKVVEHPGAEGHVDPGEGDDGGHGVGPVVHTTLTFTTPQELQRLIVVQSKQW